MDRPSKTSIADYALLTAAIASAIASESIELGFWKRVNALQGFIPLALLVVVGALVVKVNRQRRSPVHTLCAIVVVAPVIRVVVFGFFRPFSG